MALAALAVTSAQAEEKACCAAHAKNSSAMSCSQNYAKLNLSPQQKVKMEKLQAQCHKAGCTKASMDTFMKSAEGILSKEQFAMLKSECCKMPKNTKA